MKTLIVNLISDQTIPTLQFIKEFGSKGCTYLFISTKGMEKKGVRDWIVKSAKLSVGECITKEVDEFSFDSMEQQLDQIDFEEYSKIIVNITGGTKLMMLAAYEYFKLAGADIYYLTGKENHIIKLSPDRIKKVDVLKCDVSLFEYLTAYGFSCKTSEGSSLSNEYIKSFYEWFILNMTPKQRLVLTGLQPYRNKGVKIADVENLSALLSDVSFPIKDVNKTMLSKSEVKFLTGEWLEEFVFNRISEELNLKRDYIQTGITLTKKNKNGKDVSNEFDVIFVLKNRLYTIECKTSVFTPAEQQKPKTFISDTIYKADSLRKNFGLFTNASIFTLSSKNEEDGLLVPVEHIERADLSDVLIAFKEDLVNADLMCRLLNISTYVHQPN